LKARIGISVHSLKQATQAVLLLLYRDQPIRQVPKSDKLKRKTRRNKQIRAQYAEGESIPELAKAFGLSNARIHQILHGRRK